MGLLQGVTWRRIAITLATNTVVVAIVKWMLHADNPFPDLLISGQVVGFSIMFAVSAAGNLALHRTPRPVAQLAGVVLGSLIGTALVVLVKGRNLAAILYEREPLERFYATVILGLVFGGFATAFFIFRERDAQTRAALHKAEAERQRIAKQMAEAQLTLMQAQIEPHFLFNTLANVRYLLGADPDTAARMLEHLIEYLRAALPQMRESTSTLAKEIALARAYLSVQQIRMGKRLHFDVNVPDELAACAFPPAMTITLVENAIKHGVEECRERAEVIVSASAEFGRLRLTVADTGGGMKAETGSGVGLINLRTRLHELHGDAGKLLIERNSPRGVRASIEIPDPRIAI